MNVIENSSSREGLRGNEEDMQNRETAETIISEKYYRACALIHLDAVYDNLVNLKKRLAQGTKVMAIIKTDGYGHGAIPVAHTIDSLVDAYGVATVDEAVNLRRHGIKKPVCVIGYTHESQYVRLIENEIRPAVFTYEMAALLSEQAVLQDKKVRIHIKIDTGMSRIGFAPTDESVEIIEKISRLPNVEIEGIFTHFATADEKDKRKTEKQFERFLYVIDSLKERGISIPVRHCANSAAMMELPQFHLDCVRAGIAMYGLYPSSEVDRSLVILTPALELKSHVTYVKTIPQGTEVSYGGTFVADKEMRIATIPLGYGDGYRRSLSGKGYVLIHGQKAPILGRVCMDQFMVDVTEIADVCKDDEVVLIGSQGAETITAEQLAQMAGDTFNYEIVCDIGKRIPRVFLREGKFAGSKDYFDDHYEC